jgi:uracil-DNA glycosylase family 4
MTYFDEEIHLCGTKLKISDYFQKGKGRGKKILILGESLALDGWVRSGRAFYKQNGKLVPSGVRLNELLGLIDLRLEECGFTELAKCYIGKNRKSLKECSRKCWPCLMEQTEINDPKVIIILGKTTSDIFSELAKSDLKMGIINKVKLNEKDHLVLPIYHPSPINPHGRRKNLEIMGNYREYLLDLLG